MEIEWSFLLWAYLSLHFGLQVAVFKMSENNDWRTDTETFKEQGKVEVINTGPFLFKKRNPVGYFLLQ